MIILQLSSKKHLGNIKHTMNTKKPFVLILSFCITSNCSWPSELRVVKHTWQTPKDVHYLFLGRQHTNLCGSKTVRFMSDVFQRLKVKSNNKDSDCSPTIERVREAFMWNHDLFWDWINNVSTTGLFVSLNTKILFFR